MKYTDEQKKYVLEIHYEIKSNKNLSFSNDFVRLFNQQYPGIDISLKVLNNIASEMKVRNILFKSYFKFFFQLFQNRKERRKNHPNLRLTTQYQLDLRARKGETLDHQFTKRNTIHTLFRRIKFVAHVKK